MRIPILRSLSPRRRKVLLWAVGLFLAYLVVGFLILPPIVRAVAVRLLSKQLNREVSIRKVKINPLMLSATVRGLLIKDKDGEPFVSWDEVYVNFQLSSFFGHAWVFKEISTSKPFVRVQMNKDYTFNFSDLIAKFSSNAPPKEPPKPLALRVDRLHIAGASASLTDLTPRTPFQRTLGPLDVTLVGFRTDPSNRNPYSFAGTTDAGEKFSWSGYFYLNPLRSEGSFALENITLNKYAPLYQDFVRFQIQDGTADVRSTYHFELGASNRVASVTNSSFALRSFKLTEPDGASVAELSEFSVTGASGDAIRRQAEVGAVSVSGGRLHIRRAPGNAINVVEMSKPVEGMTNAPGGVLVLLRAVTNAVALLLNSTNAWAGTLHEVNVTNCALSLEDSSTTRPVRLELDEIALAARHISNLPGTNLTASLALRWNTNGTIRADVEASFTPPTADIHVQLDKLELRPLDPYLEPKLNVFVLDSKLGMDGHIRLRTVENQLPDVTFAGDVRLDDFATVDGVRAEDLLKWGSVRLSGMDANLNPPSVAIKEIAVDDAYARVVIETNRTINLLTALRSEPPPEPAAAEPAVKEKSGKKTAIPPVTFAPATNGTGVLPRISVASVVISNAQVRFTDRSLTPNVNMTIQKAGGTVAGLSSDELQHAQVDLRASVDNVGPVEITGTINPFRENLTNDLKISVKNVDLTPASPYVGKFAGYRLAKGKLNMDLAYHLHDRKIESQNLIVLDQFTFGEKVNSPDATKLPVRLAVAILKDRSGKIELDVPIEGSLDDPEFKLNKVIVHAIVNVITKIATSPFAALGAVFGGKGDDLSFQDFAPGSAELTPAGREKLDGLIKGLYERPALQVDVEGSVDPTTDLEGLRHVALDKQMRTRKWMSMRKSESSAITPDQVTLDAGEREYWLKRIYSEALAKGEINLSAPSGEANASATNQPAGGAGGRAAAAPAPSSEIQKGATALVQRQTQLLLMKASGREGGATQPKRTVEQVMEDLLLNTMVVNESDFQGLAAARAKAVRDYILQSGKVEAERVFLVENQSGSVKSEGSRAYLQLK